MRGVPDALLRLAPLPQRAPRLRAVPAWLSGVPAAEAQTAPAPFADGGAEAAGLAAFAAVAAERAPALARLLRPPGPWRAGREEGPGFSWRCAQRDALAALGALSARLDLAARRLLLSGRVDAAPHRGKPAQAYSLSTPDGPLVSLWWAGDAASASVLAHELGHASAQCLRSAPAPSRALEEAFAFMAETAFHHHRRGLSGARAHRRQHLFDLLIRQPAIAAFEADGQPDRDCAFEAALTRMAPHLDWAGAGPGWRESPQMRHRPGEALLYAAAAALALVLSPRILEGGQSGRATYLEQVMTGRSLDTLAASFGRTLDASLFHAAFDAAEAFGR